MARLPRPYIVQKRSDTDTFILTLTVAAGLPTHVYAAWRRRSFVHFPDALAVYRRPKNKTSAERGAQALVEYLRKAENPHTDFGDPTVGEWLTRFTALDGNPRAARLIGKGLPYSPRTIITYRTNFDLYLKNDPLMKRRMGSLSQEDMLALTSRLGEMRIGKPQKKKPNDPAKNAGYKMAGTHTLEIIVKFVRMAFREYGKTHSRWLNPFQSIDAPKALIRKSRDILTEREVLKLFASAAFSEPMEKAVCAAMFWAGMRRSEIFALKPEHLDWETPKIKVEAAWKVFDKAEREYGDPKWHKIREVPFPPQLQEAIKELWESEGRYDFVFAWNPSRKKPGRAIFAGDCCFPGGTWWRQHMRKWMALSGIDLKGRTIVPHSARHSLATMLDDRGVAARHIQDLLGHSDWKTTKGYLHEVEGTLAKIGKKIAKPKKEKV